MSPKLEEFSETLSQKIKGAGDIAQLDSAELTLQYHRRVLTASEEKKVKTTFPINPCKWILDTIQLLLIRSKLMR